MNIYGWTADSLYLKCIYIAICKYSEVQSPVCVITLDLKLSATADQ